MENNTKPSVPKFKLESVRRFLFILLIFGLSFTLGYLVRGKDVLGSVKTDAPSLKLDLDRSVPEGREDLDFHLFWQVWDTVETYYFDKSKIDESELVYGAIKGMVAAVGDPYTVFLPPQENKVTQEDLSGNFEGVGIQIGFRGNQLAVISPLPGSPGEEAGILPGDIIAGIKDEQKDIERGTVGITLPEAVQIIRGPADSTVTLSLLREGEDQPIIVDVVRKTIEVPSVLTNFVGENENIAHVRVLRFGGETRNEWNDAMLEVQKKGQIDGIIVDVRNNPGGYMQAAIDLGAEFLELGDVVVIEETGSGDKIEFPTERTGRFQNDEVVLLVNGGSASASEILAGALRDNIGAKLIGETTFGKGTIQEPKQLEGGVGLHITISRWLTPSGYWVNEQGLVPDFELKNDPETPEDEQLEEAIKYLSGNSQTAGI